MVTVRYILHPSHNEVHEHSVERGDACEEFVSTLDELRIFMYWIVQPNGNVSYIKPN